MTLLFDKDRPIKSPALAPAQEAFERAEGELTIGLVNNMPDSALKATERQFMRLVQAASGGTASTSIASRCRQSARSKQASEHIDHDYADIADLDRLGIDGLIVTGAEPVAANLARTSRSGTSSPRSSIGPGPIRARPSGPAWRRMRR